MAINKNDILPMIGNIASRIIGFDPNGNPITNAADSLPAIGATAGAVGGAMIPAGNLTGVPEVAGAGLGYNAGEYADSKLTGKKYDPFSAANALQTGIAMGTEGLGQGLNKAINMRAGQIGAKKAQAPLNQFKTKPTDITDFATKHGSGTGLLDYINNFKKMAGDTWDGTAESFDQNVRQPLYNEYNKLLGNGNVRVQRSDIEAAYNNKINVAKFQNGGQENNYTKALEAERDNQLRFLDEATKGDNANGYDAQIVNGRKTYVDKQTPDPQFQLTPGQTSNINRTSGDILRKSVYDAADQAGDPVMSGQLKQTGQHLKAAEGINDIANDTLALKGAGKFPTATAQNGGLVTKGGMLRYGLEAGLGSLLGAHMGLPPEVTALATPAISESLLKFQDPLISGASATLNNPYAKNALRTGAQVAGNSLVGRNLPGNIGNNGQAQNPNNPSHSFNDSTNPEQNPQDILHDPAYNKTTGKWSVPSDIKPFSVPGDTGITLQQYTDKAGQLVDNPNSAAQWDKKWAATKDAREKYLSQNTPAGASQYVNMEYPNTVNQVNALSDIIRKYGSATGIQNLNQLVQYAEAQHDPQAAVAQGLMSDLKAVTTKQSAGRFTEFDSSFLSNMPQPTDSKEGALAKIDRAMKTASDQYRQLAPYVYYSTDTGRIESPNATPTPTPVQTRQTGQMPPISQPTQQPLPTVAPFPMLR